jgi:hypothetical protein
VSCGWQQWPSSDSVVDRNYVFCRQFYDAWGEEATVLDQYFSAVVCLYLPHSRGMWYNADDDIVNGAEVYASQMGKLKVELRCATSVALRALSVMWGPCTGYPP